MNVRLIFAFLITVAAFSFSGCGESKPADTTTTAPQPQVKPDPNRQFSSFETSFHQETLPFAIPHNYPPGGTSLIEEMQDLFLGRKVEAYPMFRFQLPNEHRAFVTVEKQDENFNYILNIFGKGEKALGHRLVAGKANGTIIDAQFAEDGTWTETRTPVGEDGTPSGDPTTTAHTLSSDGQVIDQ